MNHALFSRRHLLRSTAGGVAVAVAAPASIALAVPNQPSSTQDAEPIRSGDYCLESYEWEMLSLINSFRASYGIGKLSMSATLAAAAEHHSRDMVSRNYFGHTLSDGTTWLTNIRNHGYTYSTYTAENIAAGNSTATNTFNQWKNSSGHRANMLSVNYKAIGVGRAYGASATYRYYWTTTFGGIVTSAPC